MSVGYRHRDTRRHRVRGALRLASSVSVLAAVGAWVAGCGDPQPPVAVGGIPNLTVEVGITEVVDLAEYFSHSDGDILTYAANSSNTSIATVRISDATALVRGIAAGNATVTVTATDPDGLSADQAFTVTVPNRGPVAGEPIEDIELFVGQEALVDASGNFSDPDGDTLSYTANTSDPRVATVFVSGSAVVVIGVSEGVDTVTVTATDPGELSAVQTFTVTVPNRAPVAGEPI
ncbi:MAG: Ig-like domain-containing protein [Gemmatimonadetes bacterium]|nr:Ig-like domain-containing protein [Gemmatimonadota bacterium]